MKERARNGCVLEVELTGPADGFSSGSEGKIIKNNYPRFMA